MEDLLFGRPLPTFASLLKMTPISDGARGHLAKVYSALTVGVFVSMAGCWFQLKVYQSGQPLAALLAFACLMALMSSVDGPKGNSRLACFFGFTFFKGYAVGPLVGAVSARDPGLVAVALLGTLAVFINFSLAAIFARRRQFLFLGGILGSAALFMFVVSIVNTLFLTVPWISDLQLYGGLAMFLGYLLYDTQMTIEAFEAGSRDFLRHACELYIDGIAIFVRLVVILMRRSGDSRRSKDGRTCRQ